MVNIYQIFGKVLLNINDPLCVLPGNEQDRDNENVVNTYLFYQACNAHDMSVFETSISMQRSHDTLASDISV